MAYSRTFDPSLGTSKTLLTLRAQLIDSDGDPNGAEITTGFTEIGGGLYTFLASLPDAFRGWVFVYESGIPETVLWFAAVNVEDAEAVLAAKTAAEAVSGRLTDTRAGYLDKLNVSGTLAHSDDAVTYKADVATPLAAAVAALSGADGDTLKTLSDQIDAIPITSALGIGSDQVTLTITSSLTALANASVWITSDAEGLTPVAGPLTTNASGQVTFLLTAGVTYYLWMQKTGHNPISGQSFVAEADA